MERILAWLSERKWLNLSLVLVYFAAVVLPHKKFGSFLNDVVFKGITRDQYNRYVLIVAVSALIIYLLFVIRNAWLHTDRNRLIYYLLINILLSALIIKILFVINIEVIHFPQYAFLSILLFPFTFNYTQTLILSTLMGTLDEAYQYFYLAPKDTSYYDFNDVITNLVGTVFGLLLIRSLGINEVKTKRWYCSPAFLSISMLLLFISVLGLIGEFTVFPDDEARFQLVKIQESGFWKTIYPAVTYHVMRPWEGILGSIFLCLVYRKIGSDS